MARRSQGTVAGPISAPPIHLVVDRRDCQAPSTAFVERMVLFAEEQRDRLTGGRVAVVVDSPAAFGMGRMLELKLETSGVDVAARVFREWIEAEQWLDASSSLGKA